MKNSQKQKIGVVGLGIMGLAMAKNIKAAGYSVTVYSRSAAKRQSAAEGGLQVVNSAQEAAATADILLIIVTDARAVEDVLNGKSGVFASDLSGKTVIQMGTIDEASTLRFAAEVTKKGAAFLDCPVTGSKKQVEAAQLILLAGGEKELIDRCQDLLLSMGKKIVHAGGVGKGTALKLCMNLIVAQMTTALAESVALAEGQELNPERIFDVIENSPALNCGYFQIKKTALLNQDYSPAFSLDNMLKDVRFINEAASARRIKLPVSLAVQSLMEATAQAGFGAEDLSSVAKIVRPLKEVSSWKK